MTRYQKSAPFTSERLDLLAEIERRHFWFAGRRVLVERLISQFADEPGIALDVGVGGGLQSERLAKRGHTVVPVDFLDSGLRRIVDPEGGVLCVQSTAELLPFTDESFDLILALDVLEHANDREAINEIYRVLRPGGVLILTVPAFAWLWSTRDELAGHKRRYTATTVRQLFSVAALQEVTIGYYQCLLFPIVVLTRMLARTRQQLRDLEDMPPSPINVMFRWIALLEVRLGRRVRWPFGSSVFAVAKRGEAHD